RPLFRGPIPGRTGNVRRRSWRAGCMTEWTPLRAGGAELTRTRGRCVMGAKRCLGLSSIMAALVVCGCQNSAPVTRGNPPTGTAQKWNDRPGQITGQPITGTGTAPGFSGGPVVPPPQFGGTNNFGGANNFGGGNNFGAPNLNPNGVRNVPSSGFNNPNMSP